MSGLEGGMENSFRQAWHPRCMEGRAADVRRGRLRLRRWATQE